MPPCRWLLAPALLSLLTVCRQAKPAEEKWSLKNVIANGRETALPPWANEFDLRNREEKGPVFLSLDHPIVGGHLILRRVAVIEAWDLAEGKTVWKLPAACGMMGWTLDGCRVISVLPEGPADRAGVVRGDEVVALNGRPFEPWRRTPFRAGERVILDLRSTGGVRSVNVVPCVPPEPFGDEPKVAGIVGSDLMIERTACVERLRTADGQVVWSHPGKWLAGGRDTAVLESEDGLVSVDLATGTERWKAVPAVRGVFLTRAKWTRMGPLVVHQADLGLRIDRLDAGTGKIAWSFTAQGHPGADLDVFDCDRLLIASYRCSARDMSGWGGTPSCENPACVTYQLVDLKSGELLWTRPSGGRRHGGSDRHSLPKYIPFDPLLGGPGKAVSERLLWFDVAKEILTIIDPASLREEHSVKLGGATGYSRIAPSGMIGIDAPGGVRCVDLKSGQVRETGLIQKRHGHFVLSGDRLYRPSNETVVEGNTVLLQEGGTSGVEVYDLSTQPFTLLWRQEMNAMYWPSLAVSDGRVMISMPKAIGGPDWFFLRDAATGKELLSLSLDMTVGERTWAYALADPYLVLRTTTGIKIFRRDDAARVR